MIVCVHLVAVVGLGFKLLALLGSSTVPIIIFVTMMNKYVKVQKIVFGLVTK
jgi:hypothetical protein